MSISLGGLKINDTFVINLPHRKDRRQKFRKMLKKNKIKLFPQFLKATLNEENPEEGRFQSHIDAIKIARKKKYKSILIFEDDAHIYAKPFYIPNPPPDWEMLYLGGNLEYAYEEDNEVENSNTNTEWRKYWVKGHFLTTHAYIVNHTIFQDIIKAGTKEMKNMSLDEFYCKFIHHTFPSYMIVPEYVAQRDGYSDTQKREITYQQTLTKTLNPPEDIDNTPTSTIKTITEDGEEILENRLTLPTISNADLPMVTLITPVCNRKEMFDFITYCFYTQQYPADKLRWIIADDSDEDQKVRELVPGDDLRIQYINCKVGKKSYLSVPYKINLCIEKYSIDGPQVILHFFDSVYYPPHSVMSRVKVLMGNENKQCVGCTEFGVFDFIKNKSSISYHADRYGNKNIYELTSMGYWKSWWEERQFDPQSVSNPAHLFTLRRIDQCVQLDYLTVMYKLHCDKFILRNRVTEREKQVVSQGTKGGFFETFSKETQEFILLLKNSYSK